MVVPRSYRPGEALPLVFNFHGLGGDGRNQQTLSGLDKKAEQARFLLLSPDGLDRAWHTLREEGLEADEQFARDLIAAVKAEYGVDPKRIYATGFSNGGGMANRLGCDMADVFAAIAPNAGAYYGWRDCAPSQPVAVLGFHGLDDAVVPYDGVQGSLPSAPEWAAGWATRNGCEPKPLEDSPAETVTRLSWSGCRDGAEVMLYTLTKHGHSWPGSQFMPRHNTSYALDAAEEIWRFFEKHPKK
jgi:polyhydroxybutyrate depolymerase